MDIRLKIQKIITDTLAGMEGFNSGVSDFEVTFPKDLSHGDFTSNIAMRLQAGSGKPAFEIAQQICDRITKQLTPDSPIETILARKPGFINFFLKKQVFDDFTLKLISQGRLALEQDLGKKRKVQIEFVSANPTGPLSVAHGRQAAVGEALARIFSFFNYDVTREYYLNDEGNQIRILAESVLARLGQLKGHNIEFPQDGYQGEYIKDIAGVLNKNIRFKLLYALSGKDSPAFKQAVKDYSLKFILSIIKEELRDFGVRFDVWFSQKQLQSGSKIEDTLKSLKEKGFIYEKEGAVWFSSTSFGDDKDRVLIKSDKSFTYLTPDIAYHKDKFQRGFDRVINIWGPDHHGYIPRMKAAVEALGVSPDKLTVVIVQLARLFRQGKPVVMSTRRAEYITLREVMDEVGTDAAKFFFLSRRTDSHLDFDLELAKKQSRENPIYYIQYAHARIMSVKRQAKKASLNENRADLGLLEQDEEKVLLRMLLRFPYFIRASLDIVDPYPLSQALLELANQFHRYYDRYRILDDANKELSQARLTLVSACDRMIMVGLDLFAISAPDRM